MTHGHGPEEMTERIYLFFTYLTFLYELKRRIFFLFFFFFFVLSDDRIILFCLATDFVCVS
jgi:hypothetical protein